MDLGCGITFDIFTHVFTRVVVLNLLIYVQKQIKCTIDDLEDRYNVELKECSYNYSDKYGQM